MALGIRVRTVFGATRHHDHLTGADDDLPVAELDGYWVSDDSRYPLAAPPPGHRWVRQQDDPYLLVAAATGVIVDMLTR